VRLHLDAFYMNPTDAIKAFKDLKARFMVPIHWGTLVLGKEGLHRPKQYLKKAIAKENLEKRVIILHHLEKREFSSNGSS